MNFAILRNDFSFESLKFRVFEHHSCSSLAMLFNMSLNQINDLIKGTINIVKIKKKETAGVNVNRNNEAVLTMSTSSPCLYVNY